MLSGVEKEKAYSVEAIRKSGIASAYAPWKEKEIQQLKFLYNAGIPIEKIAQKHGRTVGSIKSRLKKEGLL